jgi:FMN reductase
MSSSNSQPDDRPVVVVVGNPQAASRTTRVATEVGERIARLADLGPVVTIELADLASGLFDWGDARVAAAKETVLGATVLVVASPTYKASYTGLLKAFLDRFDRGELADVRAVVPLHTGAGPTHALAVEVHLRPVLVEIGASQPTSGLYVSGGAIDEPAALLDEWFETAGPILRRSVAGA